MLLVPFVDNDELDNHFINKELFVEEGELGGGSMLGLPKICGYVGSGAWGIKCIFLLLDIQLSYKLVFQIGATTYDFKLLLCIYAS